MIKLPAREDGVWTVRQDNAKLPDIVATRNVSFDKNGFLSLSKPTIAFINYDDDNDLGLPIAFPRIATGGNQYKCLTTNKQFWADFRYGGLLAFEDASSNVPTGVNTTSAGSAFFNRETVFIEDTDIKTMDLDGAWTDESPATAPDSGRTHPATTFANRVALAVGSGSNVYQYNTSFASGGSTLAIPGDYYAVSMAYNRNFIAVGTEDRGFQGKAYVFIWDGNTTAANYGYPVNAETVFLVFPYRDTFGFLTATGQILVWSGSGLTHLGALPVYYGSGQIGWTHTDQVCHTNSYLNDGSIVLLNISSALASTDEKKRKYIHTQPQGIWCVDEDIGLYHRHATTSATAQVERIYARNVNTVDNKITVSSAPDTGTPVFYADGGSSVGGLTDETIYYTIKVDATTVKLATTYARAIAGTAVDITSAPDRSIVLTGGVSTANDTIAVTRRTGTGTPAYYEDNGGTAITELSDETTYYAIYNSSTTVKLATSVANASAGTAINLTGTGNDAQTFDFGAPTLTFIPKSDFGQSFSTLAQGAIAQFPSIDKTLGGYPAESGVMPFQYLWGAEVAERTTTEKTCAGYVLRGTENRGYFTTSQMLSSQVQDDWQKLFIKHSILDGEFDKICIKYRIDRDTPIVEILFAEGASNGSITWVDADTFTSTDTQYANVLAGDEVEVVQGAGSGYLAHVTSITVNAGTYTVNLDEAVKNISTSDTGRAVVSRWTKLTTLTSNTLTNEDGYSEILVGVKSKSIQFKIELRGEDVEIEEILVAHELYKPVA
jgi:hypothetical protein